MKKLTQKHYDFINEYLNSLDGESAALKAGYKNQNIKKTVEMLLSDKDIIREIKSQLNLHISTLRVHKGYVIQKLLQIAEFSLIEEEIQDKEGNPTGKIKLRDTSAALKALDSLCKYLGFGTKEDKDFSEAKIITISNLDDKKI